MAKSKGYENIYGLLMRQRRAVPNIGSSRQLPLPSPASRQSSTSTASMDAHPLHQSIATIMPSIAREPSVSAGGQAASSEVGGGGVEQSGAVRINNNDSSNPAAAAPAKKKTVSKIQESAALDNLYNSEVDKDGKSRQQSMSLKEKSALSAAGQYTLIGGESSFNALNEDEATIALKSILDKERQTRIALESKVSTIAFTFYQLLLAVARRFLVVLNVLCRYRKFEKP